ncbi:MAG: DUF1016 family protein [Deltaproteobacteria bacterium]|nr:DUF1016 family protein [Deltaproteobacteria bacterium]
MPKRKTQSLTVRHPKPTFGQLVSAIRQADQYFASQANRAVNISLTLRNWAIGFYVAHYELHGADRAVYGKNLFLELSKQLEKLKVSNCRSRQLYYYALFYRAYPQILRSLTAKFEVLFPETMMVGKKVRSVTAKMQTDPDKVIENLSYTHLEQLISLDDPLKRAFYEIECIRGRWSVRELKRQINSLLFERTGLSKNKKRLLSLTHKKSEPNSPELSIRDPYIFEFLGLKAKEVMGESNLEDALLDKLKEFILELGHGFCFKARQKRINIGGEYFFVDLVFYHRILKCHILIELKLDGFKHEYLGQLNTYVGYYAKQELAEDDNPPIGILLCTKKNRALVEYALAGMNNKLFVSKYQVELPKKKEIEKFFEATLKEIK